MGTISKDFSYNEFEHTDYAEFKYKNMIKDTTVRTSIKALVDNVLQPLRDAWRKPLRINSGYRCPELNAKVGGVPTSQHREGSAADVSCDNPLALAQLAYDMVLPFDQMILYPTFVHFSHKLNGPQRKQILYNYRYKGGKVKL